MRRLLVVVLVVGCQQRASGPTTGSGSAVGSATHASPPVALGSAAAPVADAASSSCDVNGSYRLRFRTNGEDGWWMRLRVVNNQATVDSDAEMLGLLGAPTVTTVDRNACSLTLTANTAKNGEMKVALVVAGDKVAGTLARSDPYEDKIAPISGLREIAPPDLPKCLHPGVYEVSVGSVKKWKLEGHPKIGGCKEMADLNVIHVRLERLGSELYIDSVSGEPPYGQTFGRATVRRRGDCMFTMGIEVDDFRLHEAQIELDGDTGTGTTSDFTYQVMEDGEAGENMWQCHTQHGAVAWKRVAD
jgi:hypothetical protein